MRKRVVLALVLILALVMSTSCSLIVKDEAVDMATPVLEVNGQVFTKGEVKAQTEYYLDENEYMYSYYYGMPFDRTSESAIATAQSQAIQYLTEKAVVDGKLAEYGFTTFTDEELAEIEAQAKEDYQLYYETIQNFFFSGSELTGDELDAAIKAEMASMGYPDEASLVESYKYTKAQEKLIAEMNKDVAVSEEEVVTEYNARVEEDKAAYEANPAAYGTALMDGASPYYAPAGYRYVKHILLQFAAEDQTFIDELKLTISEKQTERAAAEAEGKDTAAIDADLEMLQGDLTAALEQAYAKLQPTVDEINAKIAEGADFAELIAQYNQDPGMTDESAGYPVSAVSTDWVTEFADASMALTAVGDVSAPVRSDFGIHIIRYESDIAEGEIGLETVRDKLMEAMLTEKQASNVETMLNQWVEEANIVIHEKEL